MMANSLSPAYKHWQRIIRLWPSDPVRPQNVSFQHLMQQRLSKLHPPPASPSATAATDSLKPNHAPVSAVPSPTWNEAQQLRQVHALDSLLENRFANAHPLPASLRRPSSHPDHYDVLVRELEEAPTRSWFGALLKRLRGSLRFS